MDTDEDLERSARHLRQLAGVDDRFCVDLIYVGNRIKELGLISDLVRVPDNEMGKNEAAFDGDSRTLRLKERVFYALDAFGNSSVIERRRARFTVAHELGHVVQSSAGGIRFRGSSGQLAKKHVVEIRLDEIEANRFSAAFLVPDHLASADAPPEDLCDLFDVNLPVARLRKQQLERLQRRAKGQVRALPLSIVDLLKDARDQGHRVRSLEIEMERRREEALKSGFEGVECKVCGEFKLKRSNGLLRCAGCSSTQELGT